MTRARALLGLVLAGAALCIAGAAQASWPAGASARPAAISAGDDTIDRLVLRSGRVVEGQILEEANGKIKFLVKHKLGDIEQEFLATEVLEIQRDIEVKPTDPAPDARKNRNEPLKSAAPEDGAAKLYLVECTGEFGRDLTETPLRKIVRDIKSQQPDFVVLKLDFNFQVYGIEMEDFEPNPGLAFFLLDKVRDLAVILTEEIEQDPTWEKKPKLVFWVKKALGPSAFLPFISPDIYYTSDALHGGIGYLEFMFGSTGDEVVREKQYSLRMGRAEGLGLRGGHDYRIMRAMMRTDYVLSYKLVGGRAELYERAPENEGEILLTDDGVEQNGNMDTIQEVARFQGNDVLVLNARLAEVLGISRGTVDTIQDLAFKLGVSRNYRVIRDRPDREIDDWGNAIDNAESGFRRLWREYGELTVDAPGQYRERTKFRGQQISILKEVQSLLFRYKEAINPRAIQGAPQDWETQIDFMIEQIKQQQRLDRRE